MLKKVLTPVSKALFPTYNLLTVPSMPKSTAQVAQELGSFLEGEIEAEENQKEDLKDYQNFFQNQGWKVNFHKSKIELEKTNGPYNLRILTEAKAPKNFDENEDQQQEEEKQNYDFQFIYVFINKGNNKTWLGSSFASGKGFTQLTNIRFIDDYEKILNEADNQDRIPKYQGPDPTSLDEKITQNLFEFINNLGVNNEVMERVGELSVAYEQTLYINWLKDIKSIL